MAVTPIHKAKTVKRMVVSTYQAASGAGQAAMDELEAQTKAVLDGTKVPMDIFPFQYAFNLFSHNAPMQDNGYNEEVRALSSFVLGSFWLSGMGLAMSGSCGSSSMSGSFGPLIAQQACQHQLDVVYIKKRCVSRTPTTYCASDTGYRVLRAEYMTQTLPCDEPTR
jgi:hypothetical protein